jgi:hypothetical protein
MIKGAPVNVLDYGADPTGVADSTAAIQLAVNTGKTVWIPNGTYSVTTLVLTQRYPHIVGESMVGTVLKARTATTKLIDAYETTDGQVVPLFISNLTLDGNNLVTYCVHMRFRHMSNIENCYFINATATDAAGLFAVDCWLTSINNCRFTTCYNGLNFYGSNHRSAVNSCSFTDCSNAGITCNSLGTALDGNNALVFNNCDVEFGGGLGVYLNVSDAAFYGCYMGENIGGASFSVDKGNILVSSGVVYFGFTENSFAVDGNGGRVLFDSCTVSGQTFASITRLINGGLKNNYAWQNCSIFVPVGGTPVLAGDRLGYGPPAVVFAQRLGKNYSASFNQVTFTNAVVNTNSRRLTCTSVTGTNPVLSLNCALINPTQWVEGEKLYLILVYKASTVGSLDIRLSGGPLGASPSLVLAPLPNAPDVKTLVKLDVNAPAGAYTVLELVAANCAATDYIEIQECFLADNRMLQFGANEAFTNVYKC